MASLRVAQRLTQMSHMCGLVRASSITAALPSATFRHFSLSHPAQNIPSLPPPRMSAFEQAMSEVHGDDWKSKLTARQRSFVKHNEHKREVQLKELQKRIDSGDVTVEQLAESRGYVQDETEWRAKVEKKKEELQHIISTRRDTRKDS